jgi:leucyl/phenylalanyl-tRNA--protein transferase
MSYPLNDGQMLVDLISRYRLNIKGKYLIDGRGERIRTFDPLVPNQMRYQAALRPDLLVLYGLQRYLRLQVLMSNEKTQMRVNPVRYSAYMTVQYPPLSWLAPGQKFPELEQAWGENSPAPGLLAAGGVLNNETLKRAYSKGVFPWFSDGQPILWWSPDPRMVLNVSEFHMHSSFKKTLRQFLKTESCEIRIDACTVEVIKACSASSRKGQAGTWIVNEMIEAYSCMHRDGLVHSFETWVNNELVGGLYCVALGRSVFGESMFTRSSNASKIALAALVAFCRHNGIEHIDCQQNTHHLATFGAMEISREKFTKYVSDGLEQVEPVWQFDPSYWATLHLLKNDKRNSI